MTITIDNLVVDDAGQLDPGPIARRTLFKKVEQTAAKVDEQSNPVPDPAPKKPPRETKPNPLTREQLDGRFAAAKLWDTMSRNLIAEAGGESEVSTIKRTLIEAYCGMAVRFQDLNIKSLQGQSVSLTELSLVASTMTRLASRIGIERVARDVRSLGNLILQADQLEAARDDEE